MENHVDALHLVSLCLEIFGVAVLGFEVVQGQMQEKRAHENPERTMADLSFFVTGNYKELAAWGLMQRHVDASIIATLQSKRLLAIRKRRP